MGYDGSGNNISNIFSVIRPEYLNEISSKKQCMTIIYEHDLKSEYPYRRSINEISFTV